MEKILSFEEHRLQESADTASSYLASLKKVFADAGVSVKEWFEGDDQTDPGCDIDGKWGVQIAPYYNRANPFGLGRMENDMFYGEGLYPTPEALLTAYKKKSK